MLLKYHAIKREGVRQKLPFAHNGGGGVWRGTITYHHISDQDNQSWGTHFNSERRRIKQNHIWHSSSPLFNNIWWKIPDFCTKKSLGYFAKHLTIFVPGLANLNKNFPSKPERGKVNFFENLEIVSGLLVWGGERINYEIARHLENLEVGRWGKTLLHPTLHWGASIEEDFSKYCNSRSTARIVTQLDDLL